MKLSYKDSEVSAFHPVCEAALNRALQLLSKESQYQVLHHQTTGTLEMDFAVQNIATKKYLCVVEVKRRPADVNSTRYQFQAMSYVQMNSTSSEAPFYILTNLEYALAFRYDMHRPKAFQQILVPGLTHICRLEQSEIPFLTEQLAQYFAARLSAFWANQYEYAVTQDRFAAFMEQARQDPREWKSRLAVSAYEYIRGAFSFVNRSDLVDVRLFHGQIAQICQEGARVDFDKIFSYTPDTFVPTLTEPALDTELYTLGRQNVSGDALADLLHQIVSDGHESEGEVPTDLELGRIVSVLAHSVSGALSPNAQLCDPAAGSGSLIRSAIDEFGLEPGQVLANDWNPRLAELLSLRLGLAFVETISSTNAPHILERDITTLEPQTFRQVQVIVMNPPFVAGIHCVSRRKSFFQRIRELTNSMPITQVGQMPLEAAFLELVTHLVNPGTTIACVFPQTHLTARGIEAQRIRNMLLKHFGLRIVFTYPGNGIFEQVTKGTCVLVGKARQPADTVTVLSSYEDIPNIDIHQFRAALQQPLSDAFQSIAPGITAKSVPSYILAGAVRDGWRSFNNELFLATDFVHKFFERNPAFRSLGCWNYPFKRGTIGNEGGSDLLFWKPQEPLYRKFANAKNLALKPGMKNAKADVFQIGPGDCLFFDAANTPEPLTNEILAFYMQLTPKSGRQPRNAKSVREWKKILWKQGQNQFAANSVLIPRAIRKTGKVYLAQTPLFISTNFAVLTAPTERQALLLATWMSTVFYQLLCEVSAKDQEGMRKMEVQDLQNTLIPDLDRVPDSLYTCLKAAANTLSFFDLATPVARSVDRLWANHLFGGQGQAVLDQALRLLAFLARRRNTY